MTVEELINILKTKDQDMIMKAYGKKNKCYCSGPPYERCELCKPTTKQKKKLRRQMRSILKRRYKKELVNEITKKVKNENI